MLRGESLLNQAAGISGGDIFLYGAFFIFFDQQERIWDGFAGEMYLSREIDV